ncbi:MAG: YbjN domain-containing protein [Fimbriimonadaceae bacterium]
MNLLPRILLLLPLAGIPFVPADTVTTENVKAALAKAGVVYQASQDASGDPMFDLKYDGYNARVVTYMVGESKSDIARLAWTAAIDMKEGMTPEDVNDWNSGSFDIKVYLDGERDPILEANHMVEGGVTEANIATWLTNVKKEADDFFASQGPGIGTKPLAEPRPR